MMDRWSRYPSLVGQRFGQLEVIANGPLAGQGQRTYVCRCRCGAEVIRRGCELQKWGDPSCADCKRPRWVLDDDQRKVVENYYEWMVRTVRRKWIRNFPDLEDEILSAAHEGIVFAAFYFNKQRGWSFGKLCIMQVNRKIKRDMERVFKEHQNRRRLLENVRGLAARLH